MALGRLQCFEPWPFVMLTAALKVGTSLKNQHEFADEQRNKPDEPNPSL